MGHVTDQAKAKMQSALEHFKSELKSLRSNRANPAMLDGVSVEAYGTKMRIKELATVSTPEPRQLLISPFDPSTCSAIAKGIEKENLNLLPFVEGQMIRINIPPMNEEMRKQIAKQGKEKAENAKISIREIRRKSNEQADEADLTEDEMKKEKKGIQEQTDHFCKQVDDLYTAKEKEIMTV